MGDERPYRSVHGVAQERVAEVSPVRDNGPVSVTGMPRFRKFWSTVQVAVLSAAVLFCIVMLVIGQGKLDRVYAVAAIFFGLALAGHATYLWLTARAARSGR